MSPEILQHFRRRDRVMHGVIRQVGPFTLRRQANRFGMLVRSIISQQISTSAARSIRLRLEKLVEPTGLSAASVAALSIERLRGAGLSPQKAAYLHDLAEKVASGQVRLNQIGRRTDEQVIEELVQVKGIGRWTAQMFLIFSLGRLDVFPSDDLGVKVAMAELYGLSDKPSRDELVEIGQRWSPFATVGSWYCWRHLEWRKAAKTGA
jgi:DNA-3-methyladenine glycosylase II